MPKFHKALLLSLLHPLEGCQLSAFFEPLFTDPSLQLFLLVNVHVDIVVDVGRDACIYHC